MKRNRWCRQEIVCIAHGRHMKWYAFSVFEETAEVPVNTKPKHPLWDHWGVMRSREKSLADYAETASIPPIGLEIILFLVCFLGGRSLMPDKVRCSSYNTHRDLASMMQGSRNLRCDQHPRLMLYDQTLATRQKPETTTWRRTARPHSAGIRAIRYVDRNRCHYRGFQDKHRASTWEMVYLRNALH
jgi:hypothetical protein